MHSAPKQNRAITQTLSSSQSQKMVHSYTIHFFIILSIFLLSIQSSSLSPPKNTSSFMLPITKDPETNLYYTTIGIGTPQHNMDLVIDLGGPILWYVCNSMYNSTTYNPISCFDSEKCPKGSFCSSCNNAPSKPDCSNFTCGAYIFSPFSTVPFAGDTGVDVMFISKNRVSGMLSACYDPDRFNGERSILKGLPKSSKGILGLAGSQLALQTQVASIFDLPMVFFLCLPSSNKKGLLGNLFIGGAPRNSSVISFSTPFIVRPLKKAPTQISTRDESSYEYQIFVESIKVGGKVLNLKPSLFTADENGNGGTKISTVDPFTVLRSSIYNPLVREFVKQANKRKMKEVAKVEPFGACFDLKTIGRTKTGLDVPRIDLVVAEGAVWTIYGGNWNSMVIVDDEDVACLGFVDGGKNPRTSIVVGGHQLEENPVQFDIVSSKLRFSNSLLLHNARCSQFRS